MQSTLRIEVDGDACRDEQEGSDHVSMAFSGRNAEGGVAVNALCVQ